MGAAGGGRPEVRRSVGRGKQLATAWVAGASVSHKSPVLNGPEPYPHLPSRLRVSTLLSSDTSCIKPRSSLQAGFS